MLGKARRLSVIESVAGPKVAVSPASAWQWAWVQAAAGVGREMYIRARYRQCVP